MWNILKFSYTLKNHKTLVSNILGVIDFSLPPALIENAPTATCENYVFLVNYFLKKIEVVSVKEFFWFVKPKWTNRIRGAAWLMKFKVN